MVDGIHDFTLAGRQKNRSEELIVSWIAGALSDISEEMIESSFFECIQIMILFTLVLHNHPLFSTPPPFFKVQSKLGVRVIHGCALYTGKYGN